MARKKKKKVLSKDPSIVELDGFHLKDEVWAEYFGGRIIHGKIDKLIDNKNEKIACIITAAEGYRTVLLSSCSHSIIKKSRSNKKK